MRIVSLDPGATDTVHFLGLDDALVGVSADSNWPPAVVAKLPVLNTIAIDTSIMNSAEIDAAASAGHRGASLYHVDPDRLRSARPDLILTQEICEVCGVSRRDVDPAAATLGYVPTVLSLNPATLGHVLEDVERVARAAGAPERGRALVGELQVRLDSVRRRTVGGSRPRVLCMEWLDPPYSAGHWVPEMVDLAGGRDEIGASGAYSRRLEWREVVDYAPEVLVLIPCSLELEQVAAEFPRLQARPGWAGLPAVQHKRVYACHTDLFSRSGPRLVEGVEVLARILHPQEFPALVSDGTALAMSADGERLLPFQ